MYVISLVTEYDVVEGRSYKVLNKYVEGYNVSVLDEVGDEFELTPDEYLVVEEPCYKEAYLEFIDKTEWVRAEVKELGMHRADILRERIEALQEENAELKFRLDSLEK